ncbi:MAG: transglutaminase-like domain-containing protein [Prevotellaceae bacterium]|jgi:hypothetical protein|nr:transglutaminase-like domain-containing protein [Prevotellaceae bacterium]
MRIKNTYTVTHREGTTNDIISVVMKAFDMENDSQIKDLALELQGDTPIDACINIFDFLLNNIIYVADTSTQEIRTPARLIHDRQGDCKSFSLLTCVCLRYLGIKCFFRFVSYSPYPEATHVYPCAIIDNEIIPIDVVAALQKGAPFGTELYYKFRCDMQTAKTKIAYLAGVNGRAKIGNVEDDTDGRDPSWLQRVDDDSLTQAKLWLISEWDLKWTQAQYPDSFLQYLNTLNALEYTALAIRGYLEFYRYPDELKDFFQRLAWCEYYKVFDTQDADIYSRNYDDGDKYSFVFTNPDFDKNRYLPTYNKWAVNVLNENVRIAGISGASAVEKKSKITGSGAYYIYNYGLANMTAAQKNKYSAAVRSKSGIQKLVLGYVYNESGVKKETIDNYHENGCQSAFKASPAAACEQMRVNGIKGIGIEPMMVMMIISAAIGLIGQIISWFKQKPSDSLINSGGVQPGDFSIEGGGSGGSGGGSIFSLSSMWPMLFVGGAFIMLGKKKKKKNKKIKKHKNR